MTATPAPVAPTAEPAAVPPGGRLAGPWGYAGLALTSLGGPLALSAVIAPSIVSRAAGSAGLAMVAAAVAFGVPLAIWLGYAREVSGPGGLYAFTQAAAGRRVALAQAGLWTVSYLLYILYTTAQIVYDELPGVVAGEKRYQPLLAIALPAAIAAMMIAGRRATLAVTAVLGFGQLALAASLGGLTVANIGMPAASFGGSAPAGSVAISSAQASLLYVCGSLPLFLSGEVRGGRPAVRRWLLAAYAATAVVVIASVAPLAAAPGFTRAELPGVALASGFGGRGFATAVGIAVAASIGGVVVAEYLALTRLGTAVTGWPQRWFTVGIGAISVVFAAFLLISPDAIYGALVTPSLVALWLSQLVVFAVYPRFVARRSSARATALAWALAAGASAFAIYGLVNVLQHSSAS